MYTMWLEALAITCASLMLRSSASTDSVPATQTSPSLGSTWIPLSEFNRCGPLSLLALGELTGSSWRLADVEKACPLDADGGSSAADVCRAGASLGLPLEGVRCGFEDLHRRAPGIVMLHPGEELPGHYCVVADVRQGQVLIVDPPRPAQWIPQERFAKEWDGTLICPVARASDRADRPSAGLLAFLGAVCVLLGVAMHRLAYRATTLSRALPSAPRA